MSREDILDDPASACPHLHQFLGAYFHQDWVAQREDWQGVVDDFVVESSRGDVADCADEIRGLLARGFSDSDLSAIAQRLGASVAPAALRLSTTGWLEAVLRQLDAGV